MLAGICDRIALHAASRSVDKDADGLVLVKYREGGLQAQETRVWPAGGPQGKSGRQPRHDEVAASHTADLASCN